jgi:hypothetical protein
VCCCTDSLDRTSAVAVRLDELRAAPKQSFTGFCTVSLHKRLADLEACVSAAAPDCRSTSAIRSLYFQWRRRVGAVPSGSGATALPLMSECKTGTSQIADTIPKEEWRHTSRERSGRRGRGTREGCRRLGAEGDDLVPGERRRRCRRKYLCQLRVFSSRQGRDGPCSIWFGSGAARGRLVLNIWLLSSK